MVPDFSSRSRVARTENAVLSLDKNPQLTTAKFLKGLCSLVSWAKQSRTKEVVDGSYFILFLSSIKRMLKIIRWDTELKSVNVCHFPLPAVNALFLFLLFSLFNSFMWQMPLPKKMLQKSMFDSNQFYLFPLKRCHHESWSSFLGFCQWPLLISSEKLEWFCLNEKWQKEKQRAIPELLI